MHLAWPLPLHKKGEGSGGVGEAGGWEAGGGRRENSRSGTCGPGGPANFQARPSGQTFKLTKTEKKMTRVLFKVIYKAYKAYVGSTHLLMVLDLNTSGLRPW